MSPLLLFRLCCFYLGYWVSMFWFGLTGPLLFSFAPKKMRLGYMLCWNRFIVFWVKLTCGVKYRVIGAENIPATPYVALSKHQSQWETYFLQYYLAPVRSVLKKELLSLPFFGWGLRLLDPIAIDRSNPKQALKQTQEKGVQCLEQGSSLLIFPEGTRTSAEKVAKYARGGANIAAAAGVPVVPIALNAGEYWPAHKLIKFPGTITVAIGEAIDSTQATSREITAQAEQWIETQVAAMDKRV